MEPGSSPIRTTQLLRKRSRLMIYSSDEEGDCSRSEEVRDIHCNSAQWPSSPCWSSDGKKTGYESDEHDKQSCDGVIHYKRKPPTRPLDLCDGNAHMIQIEDEPGTSTHPQHSEPPVTSGEAECPSGASNEDNEEIIITMVHDNDTPWDSGTDSDSTTSTPGYKRGKHQDLTQRDLIRAIKTEGMKYHLP